MGLKEVATVLPRKVEEMPGEEFFAALTIAEVAEPCGEGTSIPGDTAFLVASVVPSALGRLVWEPWLLPYDAFLLFNAAAAAAETGFCCAAIGLGANWLPEGTLEGVPVVAVGFEGVAMALSCEIEEMLGEAIFVPVIVVEVDEPRGEGTPVFGAAALSVASLGPGVPDRLVWGPWLLPYDAFLPFCAADAAGAEFCCAAIG